MEGDRRMKQQIKIAELLKRIETS
ncbi:MAG TPA: thiamine transporter, partial [Bacillus sp. (in: Bacteria)]|nr:thiamine transporter [Bacillus sp. (in: firmicutes)]